MFKTYHPYRKKKKVDDGVDYLINKVQGEIEQNNQIIKVGKVLKAGPACKNVEIGDDVFYTTFSETKIPFRKKGFVVVGENLIICRIIRK